LWLLALQLPEWLSDAVIFGVVFTSCDLDAVKATFGVDLNSTYDVPKHSVDVAGATARAIVLVFAHPVVSVVDPVIVTTNVPPGPVCPTPIGIAVEVTTIEAGAPGGAAGPTAFTTDVGLNRESVTKVALFHAGVTVIVPSAPVVS
jgi:hypothetical protein